MIEYWLQKKSLSRWDYVTWYTDRQAALLNLHNVAVPDNGYSWRVVEVNTIEQINLEDHTELEPAEIIPIPQSPTIKPTDIVTWGKKPSGWSDIKKSDFGSELSGWNSFKTSGDPGASGFNPPAIEHGLVGSVWMVHHGLKKKTRVPASKVDELIVQGWCKGGPATKFE